MENIKLDMKFVFNIISLLGALAWGWYQMELRISTIEMKIENYEKVGQLRDEINLLKANNG